MFSLLAFSLPVHVLESKPSVPQLLDPLGELCALLGTSQVVESRLGKAGTIGSCPSTLEHEPDRVRNRKNRVVTIGICEGLKTFLRTILSRD